MSRMSKDVHFQMMYQQYRYLGYCYTVCTIKQKAIPPYDRYSFHQRYFSYSHKYHDKLGVLSTGSAHSSTMFNSSENDKHKRIKNSFYLTRIFFLRCLAGIYVVAFTVAYMQNKQLIGDRGLLPLRSFMEQVASHYPTPFEKFTAAPTVFWLVSWGNVDWVLDAVSLSGVLLAMFVLVTGAANTLAMFTLWVLYHSLVAVGQRWYGFGWESQLLETGFLAMWMVPLFQWRAVPRDFPTPWVVIIGFRWLIIRLILGAGLIKVRGDQCWRDLTCMEYFYETQPVPNPASYFMHQLPPTAHAVETLTNHFVELVVPALILVLFPFRRARIATGFFQIAFQVILICTGNLSFLNWLTILPSIFFFDDAFLDGFGVLFDGKVVNRVLSMEREERRLRQEGGEKLDNDEDWLGLRGRVTGLRRMSFAGMVRCAVHLALGCLLAFLNYPILLNMASSQQIMNTSYDPLRLVNTYGAFGSVTKERTEIVLVGLNVTSSQTAAGDHQWLEYEFHCKPGDVSRRPCVISPYHYRLDWLMWFAAFQDYQSNPWLLHLMGKLLNSPAEVDALIAHNPFPLDQPPVAMKALLYRYSFTPICSAEANAGAWWHRELVREYVPAVDKAALEPVYRQMRWEF